MQQIARAATLQVQGKTTTQIAEALGVSPQTVAGWKKNYPEMWRTAYDHAMEDVISIVRAELDTDEILANRDLYVRRAKAHLCENSLAVYFHEEFAPDKLHNHSANTLHQYQNAIRKLSVFFGCDVALSEVNEALIDRFGEWLVSEGVGSETARKYRAYVRAIARHARPGTCLKQRGKRPHEKVAVGMDDGEWDCEGSLWRLFRDKYHPEKMVGVAAGSAQQHVIAIRSFGRFLGRAAMLTDLTDEQVTGYMQWILDQKLSRATANSKRQAILALWRFAYKKKLVGEWPCVDKLKEFRCLPVAWKVPEMEQLLAACAAAPGMLGDVPAASWWPAFVLVFFDTGLRRGAMLSITRDNLDLSTAWLTAPAIVQKQKVEQRFLLREQTMEAIRRIWLPPRRLLFLWPYTTTTLHKHYRKTLERAGLPIGRKHGFHKLRKSTASHIAKTAGVGAAARQLGHSDEYMTQRYIDPTIARSEIDGAIHLPQLKLDGENGNGEK